MRDGWRPILLGDVLTEVTRPVAVADLDVVRYAGVRWYTEGVYERTSVPASAVKGATLSTIRSGDIVYNRMWATKASFGVAHDDVDGCHVTNDFPCFEADPLQLVTEYMELMFTGAAFQAEAANRATGTTERRRLKQRDFLAIPLTLPPPADQRRIVDLIAAVDDAIEAAKGEAAAAGESLQQVGMLANERVSSGEWLTAPLSDVLGAGGIMTGPFGSALHQHDYVDEGTAVVMPKNIAGRRVRYDGIARIGNQDLERLTRYQTQAGDLLWSRRGDVTRFAVIEQADAGVLCGTGCFIVRPENTALTPWLEVWMSTPFVQDWLTERAVGATMANLNRGLLGSVPVAQVPDAERVPMISMVSAIHGAADTAHTAADALRGLRGNLLTVLLSGEHEIPTSYDRLLEAAAA